MNTGTEYWRNCKKQLTKVESGLIMIERIKVVSLDEPERRLFLCVFGKTYNML